MSLCSNLVFQIGKNIVELIVRVIVGLFAPPNDFSEVSRVLPEDKDYNDLEAERDISHQSNESTKLVFVTAILLVLIRGTRVNDEKLDEVVDPREGNQCDETAESLSRDCIGVIKDVDCQAGHCQTQEAVSLEHLE